MNTVNVRRTLTSPALTTWAGTDSHERHVMIRLKPVCNLSVYFGTDDASPDDFELAGFTSVVEGELSDDELFALLRPFLKVVFL